MDLGNKYQLSHGILDQFKMFVYSQIVKYCVMYLAQLMVLTSFYIVFRMR